MEWADLEGRHRGATALVCGTGPSLERVREAFRHDIVVGVNRACTRIRCDYTVIVDSPYRYHPTIPDKVVGGMSPDAIRAIMDSGRHGKILVGSGGGHMWNEWFADYAIFPTNPMAQHQHYPGLRDGTGKAAIPAYNGAPYAATGIAAYLGCTRIVLAGVDYTDDHAWGSEENLGKAEIKWLRLAQWMHANGVDVVNGNVESRLEAVRKEEVEGR